MKKILILALILTSNCFGYFRENSTLLIPSEYPTIQDALNDLDEKTISREVIVTLKIENGTYYLNESLLINHPYASQIQIIGNTSTPSSCTLNFNNSTDGIVVLNSASIGLIDGLTIVGTGNYGVLANQSSNITLGANVIISGFNHGVFAANSSSIDCSRITVLNASSVGITATSGSHIKAIEVSVSNCAKGVSANMKSSIQCDTSSIDNCGTACHAANDSYMHSISLVLSNNTQDFSPPANTSGNWQSYIRTQ